MGIITVFTRLFAVAALAFFGINSSQALARAADLTKIINCTGAPANIETTTLTIDLESFSIPAEWSDPGSQYEISTHYVLKVFPSTGSKAVVCQSAGNWGTRDYDMFNLWSGDRWNYPLELRIIVNNFPVQGYAYFNLYMEEEDSGLNQDDGLDLNPQPGTGKLEFSIYPDSQRAYLLRWDGTKGVEVADSTGMVVFGKSKRFIGGGQGSRLLEDVSASIDIKISSSNVPKVGGAIPAPGDKGPNLPSPGQPVPDNPNKEQNCRNYALEAVNWNQMAQQFGCPGLNPPVWSNNHQMHFDWCMLDNNVTTTAFHNGERAKAIQACQQGN